jgi:hypothetical protein
MGEERSGNEWLFLGQPHIFSVRHLHTLNLTYKLLGKAYLGVAELMYDIAIETKNDKKQ